MRFLDLDEGTKDREQFVPRRSEVPGRSDFHFLLQSGRGLGDARQCIGGPTTPAFRAAWMPEKPDRIDTSK